MLKHKIQENLTETEPLFIVIMAMTFYALLFSTFNTFSPLETATCDILNN